MRVRRGLILCALGLASAVAGAGVGLASCREELARGQVARALERLRERHGVRVSVEALAVDGFTTVQLHGARVRAEGDGPSPGALDVRRVDVTLRASALLRGHPVVESVRLVRPSLVVDPSGIAKLASRKGGKAPAGVAPAARGRPLPRVEVEGGAMEIGGLRLVLDGLEASLEPNPEGRREWALRARARLSGRTKGDCSAKGELSLGEEPGLRADVTCAEPLGWPLPVADLAARLGRIELVLAMGADKPVLRMGLGEVALVRPASDAGPEVILLKGKASVAAAEPTQIDLQATMVPGHGPGTVRFGGLVETVARRASLRLELSGIEIAKTPLVALLPFEVHAGRLAADVRIDISPRFQPIDIKGRVRLDDLVVRHKKLASTAVGGLRADLHLDASVDVPAKAVELRRNDWVLNGLPVAVDGRVELGEPVRVRGSIRSGPHLAEELSLALPPALIPALSPMEMVGTWSVDGDIDVDTSNPEDLRLDVDVDVSDLTVKSLGSVQLERVLTRFKRHFVDAKTGEEDFIWVGPAARGFTQIEQVPWTLQMALITQEDGGFYKHKGFSLLHVRGSLKRNIKEGRFARGASTISMQTVKNVFLSPEKTLSRKIQEVLITWQLEQFLDKADILELYLNVVEWGPHIFGVGQAARHFFDKTPDELTPLECVYLAAMVPAPLRYHKQFAVGRVGRLHRRRIQRLMSLMVNRRHLTPEEFEEAEAQGFAPELQPFEPADP